MLGAEELCPEIQEAFNKAKNVPWQNAGDKKVIDDFLSVIKKHATPTNLHIIIKKIICGYFALGNGNLLELTIDSLCTNSKEMLDSFYSFCSNWKQYIDYYFLNSIVRVLAKLNLDKDFVKTFSGKSLTESQIYLVYLIKLRNGIDIPDVVSQVNEKVKELKSIIESLAKPCYAPIVEDYDTTNPRVSKFGGRAPYLPCNGYHKCESCGQTTSLIFSLYVPSLPTEIQSYFPISERECVLIGLACEHCYSNLKVICYKNDEINDLIYEEIDPQFIFNENRVIKQWRQSTSYPTSLEMLKKLLPNMQSDDLLIANRIIEEEYNPNRKCVTYLGGYPLFVQGDDQPDDTVLLMEMEESYETTNPWGDCGTAQVWMTTDDNFGEFIIQFACS
ncbi:hypothetical protein GPJ56_010711 [Histomonas meleagridis]|uniref:uncharacterized protein n=1 Tax=Histomonas meleagridis TaxID=135588 RepID=UPI00355A9E5A|nr:hypothetical protein GPJ56_010711 [Histomonas meleagridis]KAH0801044.1 hypothetical protein GO595_006079 [Histomonas meleagridis]